MKTKSAKAKGRKLQDWVKEKLVEYIGDLGENLEENITTAVMGASEQMLSSPHKHSIYSRSP